MLELSLGNLIKRFNSSFPSYSKLITLTDVPLSAQLMTNGRGESTYIWRSMSNPSVYPIFLEYGLNAKQKSCIAALGSVFISN